MRLLFILILASVCLSSVAQLALKIGVGAAGRNREGVGGEVGGLMASPMVWLGLALYGAGALMWLFVLARAELSLAYAFVGPGFLLTTLAGTLYLGENISSLRIAGTALIICGCLLVGKSA